MLASLVLVGLFWIVVLSRPWDVHGVEDFFIWLLVPTYVGVGSYAMARSYGRPNLTVKQEVWTLMGLWTSAVALWTGLFLLVGLHAERNPDTGYLFNGVDPLGSLSLALFVGTICFGLWQAPALVFRAFWRKYVTHDSTETKAPAPTLSD